MAVEELEHTRILGQNPPTPRQEEPETEAVEESAQIRLEGFDDQIENVPNIDENVAERILEERRRDKVNKFRLFAPEEGQAQEGPRRIVKSDFRNADERTAILERLFAQKTAVQTGIVFTVLSGGLLLLVTLLRDTAYLPSFLASNTAYFVAVLVLYGVVLARIASGRPGAQEQRAHGLSHGLFRNRVQQGPGGSDRRYDRLHYAGA